MKKKLTTLDEIGDFLAQSLLQLLLISCFGLPIFLVFYLWDMFSEGTITIYWIVGILTVTVIIFLIGGGLNRLMKKSTIEHQDYFNRLLEYEPLVGWHGASDKQVIACVIHLARQHGKLPSLLEVEEELKRREVSMEALKESELENAAWWNEMSKIADKGLENDNNRSHTQITS